MGGKMDSPIPNVNPGDLITAAFFNQVITTINDLAQRITALEGAAPSTTEVNLKPYSGSVRVGEAITLQGANFAVPANLNTVLMDTTPITQFNPGTDTTHLSFNVPDLADLPRDVIVSVANTSGSASIIIPVLPAVQTPVGSLVLSPGDADIGIIQVGQSYDFPFLLDSQTTLPETYALSVLFNNAEGATASAWSAGTRITNALGQTITTATVAAGSPVTVRVTVTVPAGATRVDLALRAVSVSAPDDPLLNPPPLSMPLVVGQAPQISDARTTFEQMQVFPSDRLVSDPALGQVVVTPVGQETLIRVSANFTRDGTYDYSARVVPANPPGAWTVTPISPTPPHTEESDGSSQLIVVRVAADSPDPLDSRILEIHAARSGPGAPTFDSWFSVAIQST